mgnify:CR=1 FL=1
MVSKQRSLEYAPTLVHTQINFSRDSLDQYHAVSNSAELFSDVFRS